ncbi:MAG: 4-hydroxy-tetrahydrodipicolinate reductase [Actinomycetales bacterium]|nr:4-hydroxy-tetrahydrodipicolinate reductase [Actinomycetales bacterium]
MTGTTTRVAVIGALGRMGCQVRSAVEETDDLELGPCLDLGDDIETVADADVAVVFSPPDTALDHVLACIRLGVHTVVGTSGFTPDRLQVLREALAGREGIGVLVAPNFAVGAVLAMRFAELAAPHFASVEIVELHHPDKVDAPSGTATRTAEMVAASRAAAGCAPVPDATTIDPDGARGADVAGIRVHAVRLRGLVAHQEVLLGGPGEQLTLRHDSFDRTSFMPGVLLGLRTVASRPGLTVGLEHYLGI